MKKDLFLSVVLLIMAFMTSAQFKYTMTVLNQSYQPLPSSSKEFMKSVWDDSNVTIQLGFKFLLNEDTVTLFSFQQRPTFQATGRANAVYFTGFTQTDADLADRGKNFGGTHQSPVRYKVDSTSGGRIFKAEVYNAGFMKDTLGNDYTSMQIWWYEGSNIIDVWYGPSNISFPGLYFNNGMGPLMGYIADYNTTTSNFSMYYYYKGSATNPVLDSANNISAITGGLTGYPPNGTIYRFTPFATGVKHARGSLNGVRLLNSVCTGELLIDNKEEAPATYNLTAADGTILTRKANLSKGISRMDVATFPPGLYVLSVYNSTGSASYKFIKY